MRLNAPAVKLTEAQVQQAFDTLMRQMGATTDPDKLAETRGLPGWTSAPT